MANQYRGEIDANLDGRTYTLCLTLGALADLESKFRSSDLADLTRQFSSGHLSAQQLVNIIGAGLRGGGHSLTDDEVSEMRVEGGAVGYAKIVSELLQITFGGAGAGDSEASDSIPKHLSRATVQVLNPIPKTTPAPLPGTM